MSGGISFGDLRRKAAYEANPETEANIQRSPALNSISTSANKLPLRIIIRTPPAAIRTPIAWLLAIVSLKNSHVSKIVTTGSAIATMLALIAVV